MANEEYQIPIFLINGQLDSGKTRFISDTIAMGQFADAKNKLLIVCEEGEEEYSEKLLKDNGVDMVVVEKEDFNIKTLNELDKKYDPWIVIIEYNGMWDPALILGSEKPRGWQVYQSITLVDANSFGLQWANMKSIIAESVKYADMVIFNRCKSGMDLGSYRRSMRALNPALQIIFEDEKGDQVAISEQLPYDINADVIQVDDEDYGIWYMDVSERPEVYAGKKVRFKGQVLKNKYFKDKNFVPGRKVMTCCAEANGCEKNLEAYVKYIQENFEKDVEEMQKYFPVICGEWSLFNSYGTGVDTKGGQSPLNGVEANTEILSSDEKKELYSTIAKAQLNAWKKGSGHFYWNYKLLLDTVNEPGWIGWDSWDLGKCVAQDWYPIEKN